MATNLSDVYVTIIPETRRVGEAIRAAFRDAEREAKLSSERMGRDLDRELGDVHVTVKVGADTKRARREVDELKTHGQRAGEAMGTATGLAFGKMFSAQLGLVKFASLGAAGGLALSGLGGSLASIVGVASRASGALALVPAAAMGAAASVSALKLGVSGLSDAFKAMEDPQKFANALQKLSPAAQESAKAVYALKPAFDSMKNTVQDSLFAGLAPQITQLGRTYLPVVQQGFAGVAGAANQAGKSVAAWAQTPEAVGQVNKLLGNTTAGMNILATAARPAVQAVLGLGAAGSDSLPRLSQAVADVSNRFAGFVKNASESGRITEWIDAGLTSLTQLGHAIGAVGSVFATVFKAGSAVGGGMLGTITQVADKFNDFLKSADGQAALSGFFTGISQAAAALAPILGTLAQIVGTTIVPALSNLGTAVAPALNGMLQGLGAGLNAIKPVFEQLSGPLSQIGQVIGDVLAKTLPILAPALVPLAQAFADLLSAIAPLIPPIAQLASMFVQAVAPALSVVFQALAPVIQQLMDALKPVLDQLGPVLAQVAQTLAGLLVQAIQELLPPLMPLVKSFADFLAAVLPLLPAVVKVAAVIAGALVKAMAATLPLAVSVVKAMVDFSTKIANFVVPWVSKLADGFGWLGDKVKSLIGWFSGVKDAAGEASGSVSSFASATPAPFAFPQTSGGVPGGGEPSALANRLRRSAGTPEGMDRAEAGRLGQSLAASATPDANGSLLADASRLLADYATGKGDQDAVARAAELIDQASKGGAYVPDSDPPPPAVPLPPVPAPLPVPAAPVLPAPSAGKGGKAPALAPITMADLDKYDTPGLETGAPVTVAPGSPARAEQSVPATMGVDVYTGMGQTGGGSGAQQGIDFAHSMTGTAYSQQVFGRIGIDCSGMVSATVNAAEGKDPFSSRMSTVNEGEWLKAHGAVEGMGGPGDLSIGWWNKGSSGGNNGHTALTLPNGENVESGGSHGVVAVGAGAAGAGDKQFDHHMHIPKELLGSVPTAAGYAPALSGASGDWRSRTADRAVQNAQDSVKDHQWRVDQAKRRMIEAKTQQQRDMAEHALIVAERELAKSHEKLRDAQDKRAETMAKARQKGQRGGSDGAEDFGHSLVSGALSGLGLDGSLLDNPLEWSGVKWLTSMVNGFTKPAQGQQGRYGSDGAALPGFGPPASDPAQLASLGAQGLSQGFGADSGSQPSPAQVDQSINLTGQFGNPNDTARAMRAEMDNRNRAFSMNAGRM
ncbi:Phage-related protein [Segniliparus rotundus DSM 44985]|uniref:Phage-related protein n=1 Tax=Segniliparus rotundus (strain ATCC BAA-972 / CDC 1076 / CIP 108378 / DSM 44985 / JCM 13578) TaxID=640132 RepID=D6Z9P1_SEGRD|nr:hypothetical protein [Segniliparus rotundus]ADG96568.1 Phage-related protein [Segniliparus rotundus DSM 44985]